MTVLTPKFTLVEKWKTSLLERLVALLLYFQPARSIIFTARALLAP